jgi:hypothetical protein
MHATHKRRWLTFSLRTFLAVTLALSLVLGYFGRTWWKAFRDSQPPTLYELAQIAKRHGIPMPPQDAKLVLAATGGCLGDQYGYTPAFLLQEMGDGDVRFLVGTEEEPFNSKRLLHSWDYDPNVPVWREFTLDTTLHSNWQARFNRRSAFVCAAQLADRGDGVTAKAIMKLLAREKEWDFERYSEIEPELVDLRLLMARCIYDHLEYRICHESQHWPEIHDALESLLTEFPKLGDERAAVLSDLAAAINTPPAKAGSVEAQLVDWSKRFQVDFGYGVSFDKSADDIDGPIRNIILGGFDNLPQLIALRNDRRLTAHCQSGNYRFGWEGSVMRLGDLADNLLSAIVAYRGPDQDEPEQAENWIPWLDRARAMGELTFFRDAVFERDSEGSVCSVNEIPGRIIGQKYPETVRELCLDFCAQFEPGDASEVASVAASARLSHEKRVTLLKEMIEELPELRQPAVFRVFAELDKAACSEALAPALDNLSRGEMTANSVGPEAELADVVHELDDLCVWRAYLRATRRCDAELRARVVTELRYHGDVSKSHLAFLAALLDDETERDITLKEGEWRFPNEVFPVISVGNLSAKVLAELLEMKPKPDLSWTAEQWTALRDQVRERLKQEVLPELE